MNWRSLWRVVSVLVSLFVVESSFGQFGSPVPRYPHEVDGLIKLPEGYGYFTETDLSVPGRGLSLEFSRTYNGSANHWDRGPSYLGRRWGHSYQWRLTRHRRYHPYHKERIYYFVHTGSGAKISFYKRVSGATLFGSEWLPNTGVRGTLTETGSGRNHVFVYTTKHGVAYKFEVPSTDFKPYLRYQSNWVLTEITDRNNNRIQLHYESVATYKESGQPLPRLFAVTDTVGRVLKFHYGLTITDVTNPRQITKIEFGLGTARKLTTVYQTIVFDYPKTPRREHPFTAVRYKLGTGDPRGSEVVRRYDHDYHWTGRLRALYSPLGSKTDLTNNRVTQRDVPATQGSEGALLHTRRYIRQSLSLGRKTNKTIVFDDFKNGDRRVFLYDLSSAAVPKWLFVPSNPYPLLRNPHTSYSYFNTFFSFPGYALRGGGYFRWHLDTNRNVVVSAQDAGSAGDKWDYRIEYKNSTQNPNNQKRGNPTKWKQVDPAKRTKVLREWTADYDPKYNFPIWQKDSMGHKTEFSYDSKGNLTKVKRVKNTGTQPHKIAHDIVTTHAYDTYGNRIKTTSQLSTTQTQVVETKYDSTYHTYPVEVKTTITKDGKSHTIKTQMEWDVKRGLKTADVDAGGKRIEYAYWADRRLKYTKDVAANLYTVPTYDLNGNVTQVQVRQNNWQTGTLIAQKKTEYDGLGRVTKVHSFQGQLDNPLRDDRNDLRCLWRCCYHQRPTWLDNQLHLR